MENLAIDPRNFFSFSFNKFMANIDVSFVIIEYHSLEDVLLCVDSINENVSGVNHEVIVSSNSMYDSSKQKQLTHSFPHIAWSFNEHNNGFAYGMNCGIRKTKGDFIVLQNPDTRVENDKLSDALQYLKENKGIGILGPQIVNDAGEIQDTCRPFLTPGTIVLRLLKRKLSKKGAILDSDYNYDKIQNVNWVIGAYMITSRKALEKVGLLNEKFFMYVEDMEWCLRFWEKNLKVIYYPPLVINYEGDRKSTMDKSRFLPFSINKYTYIHLKNYIMFLNEHGLRKIKRLRNLHFVD